MKNFIKITIILVLVFALHITLYTLNSYAEVPYLINYQGRLTDTSGVPLDGLYNITFRLYDAEAAGNLLWQGTYNSVSITKGIFNILLGDVNDSGFNFTALGFDKPYWLEIKVGEDVLNPRQMIASVGYAIRAENLSPLDNKTLLPIMDGNQLINLKASNLSEGIVPSARLGSGTASNATFLRGDQSWAEMFKTYDSGARPFTTNGNYTITHNLGTVKIICQIFYRENADADWKICQEDYGNGRTGYTTFYKVQNDSVSFRISKNGPYYQNSDGAEIYIRSGEYKVIIIGLP